MSDTKWTPGPWKLYGGTIAWASPTGPRRHIAHMAWDVEADEYAAHDAHLIAAAPELYEALEAALDEDSGLMCADKMRAALAKARGEQVQS